MKPRTTLPLMFRLVRDTGAWKPNLAVAVGTVIVVMGLYWLDTLTGAYGTAEDSATYFGCDLPPLLASEGALAGAENLMLIAAPVSFVLGQRRRFPLAAMRLLKTKGCSEGSLVAATVIAALLHGAVFWLCCFIPIALGSQLACTGSYDLAYLRQLHEAGVVVMVRCALQASLLSCAGMCVRVVFASALAGCLVLASPNGHRVAVALMPAWVLVRGWLVPVLWFVGLPASLEAVLTMSLYGMPSGSLGERARACALGVLVLCGVVAACAVGVRYRGSALHAGRRRA